MNPQLPVKRPLLYLITEGNLTDENFKSLREAVIGKIVTAVEHGVHLVQLREKSLSTRNLMELSFEARSACKASLLVNDRFDVALATGLDGVHLTEASMSTAVVRNVVKDRLLIGRSCHDTNGLRDAERGGADFAVLGPVFSTPGKGDGLGLEGFREMRANVPALPVLGIGGIDAQNIHSVIDAGGDGIAAIRFLNDVQALAHLTLL